MSLNRKILVVAVLVVGLIIWTTLSKNPLDQFSTEFVEVAFHMNENNTGPVRRVYLVTVSDTLWSEMREYGDLQLHAKMGNTKVFFFSGSKPYPVSAEGNSPHFNPIYNPNCLGLYEKNASGLVSFRKYPFQ